MPQYGENVSLGLNTSCVMQPQLGQLCCQPGAVSYQIQHLCMLMMWCFPAIKPLNDSCHFACLHVIGRTFLSSSLCNSSSSLLISVACYSTETPCSVCYGAGNFTVNSTGMGGRPPVALHPSSLSPSLFFIFIYIYICRSATSQSKEHLVPLGPAVTTLRECHIKSSLHPARREERRAKREEEEERKSGTNSVSHTHRKSVFAHGKIAAHICGVALRIHQSPCPDRFTRADSLTLAPTLIFLLL